MPAAERRHRVEPQRRPYLIGALAGLAVFVLVAVLVRTGVTDPFDANVTSNVPAQRRPTFTDLADALDYLDTWWLLALIVAGLVLGLWWSRRMVQAIYLGVCVVVALVLNPLLKLALERPRPQGGLVTVSSEAFPSGHTTMATTIATALTIIFWPTRWRWPMLALAVAFSLGMAGSRVYLGAHWPTDVVGGLALGVSVAMAVRLLMPWPTPEEAERARDAPGTRRPAPSAAGDGTAAPAIDVVFLDWGNKLMVDNGMREGPMKDWDKVEAEAGAQEALLHLRNRYRLVVATNAEDSPAHYVRMALARVGLDEYVDDVVSSADVGDHKPNYAFFRAALLAQGERGLPLNPQRAVMVGDGTTNDIAGAQRAGMRTIWYNPTQRRFPPGATPPDAEIKKLIDLPSAVDRLAGVAPEKRSRRRRKAEAEAAAAEAAAAASRDLRAESASEDSRASAAAAIPATPALAQALVSQDTPPPTGFGPSPAAPSSPDETAPEPAETPAAPHNGR